MGMKRSKRRLSIGAKTMLSHLVLCVAVIALASVLSYAISSQYIRDARIEDLLEKAGRIAESSHSASQSVLMPQRHIVRTYEKLTDAKVFFLDADTEKIRMYGPYPKPSPKPAAKVESAKLTDDSRWFEVLDAIDREFARRVLSGEKVSAMQHFEFAQDNIIFAGVPIISEDGMVRGGVVLAQPVDELHSLSRMLRYMLVIVVSVSLLLAVILSMQLTWVMVRPIRRITRAARRMENGLYAERITDLPGDEIGEMGHALNSMSSRLINVIRRIRKERDKLELLVSGIGEGMIAVDTQWNILRVNTTFLELTELENAAAFLEAGERYQPLKNLLVDCMAGGTAKSMDWENPSRRAIHANAAPFKDERGAILGTVCLMRDVSEAQRMEQLRRDYVANISHELRTPLTGIRGMVEPLIDGIMETEEERMDSYRIILKETIRLEKLVGEMLDMSRLQDGRIVLELEPLELPGILDAAVRSMAAIAEETGVSLRVETDGTRLACMGNEDRIMQVLVILMDNALSFTPRGGEVVVFARDGAEYISVGVRDNGCGIEPKDLPLIWERFYKADKSRMRTTGTGLGLSIARLVTRLMGGDITVRSEPGAGAEFTFTLKKV